MLVLQEDFQERISTASLHHPSKENVIYSLVVTSHKAVVNKYVKYQRHALFVKSGRTICRRSLKREKLYPL